MRTPRNKPPGDSKICFLHGDWLTLRSRGQPRAESLGRSEILQFPVIRSWLVPEQTLTMKASWPGRPLPINLISLCLLATASSNGKPSIKLCLRVSLTRTDSLSGIPESCSLATRSNNGRHLVHFPQSLSYQGAMDHCRSKGGRLADLSAVDDLLLAVYLHHGKISLQYSPFRVQISGDA